MEIKSFEPQFMKIGVLTAAFQELTPRNLRDADPDRAIEDWIAFAREVGADNLQLSAAFHPTQSDVPADALLDPVANTLDLREPFTTQRARRVSNAMARASNRPVRPRLFRQHAARGPSDQKEETRLHDPRF